ncbi:hypothetical protein [Pseudomonas sp.]|jgi:hypothetical protein|uniref:hypothetical protein n=1 Tax=Pseudomonas sp. TaxID=306 RepID=UPI00272BBB23|nr:hypothetical protein [Pseudomonas sp.]
MKMHRLLILALPLAVALPATAASWPDGAQEQFIEQCMANLDSPQAQAFCRCAADEVADEFSQAELEAMGTQLEVDPEMRQRLISASGRCEGQL